MTVAEVARLLNVSRCYVTRLMHESRLGEVIAVDGKKHVLRANAEAYHRDRQRIGNTALREMTRVQQEAGAYELGDKNDDE
ncbi:hypothetical protein [Paraburkholderia piptadeniae]|nr:hypothetical protein [Paraburkholderia piptadeniae]